jgi:hypothetical protein
MSVDREPDPPEAVARRLARMAELRRSADEHASRAVAALNRLSQELRRAEVARRR